MTQLSPSTSFIPSHHDLSQWYNLTAWTVNVTRYAPSFEDLVWAGPRMVKKLGLYMSLTDSLGALSTQYLSTNAAGDAGRAVTTEANLYHLIQPAGPLSATTNTFGDDFITSQAAGLPNDGVRSFSGVVSYATSRWATSCVAMAIILNRTHIFAATRRRLQLNFVQRFLLRILPVVFLIVQIRHLLQSIQCQTSSNFAELRWGNASKSSDLLFTNRNDFLNTLSSSLLLGATDEQSCVAVHMVPSAESGSARDLSGSLSRLWPLFKTFCLSHFVETIVCAVQGRLVAAETGMTLFEQSLAFAEADASVSSRLGINAFAKPATSTTISNGAGLSVTLTPTMVLKRVNTPVEVLIVALLSSLTHLSSHILGIFNKQARYRLFNTGIWGICFMGSMVTSALFFDIDDPDSQGLLRYPTVCVVGFVPHVFVLAGIIMCTTIYGFALLLCALALPENSSQPSLSLRQRLAIARENMQYNVSFSEMRITREMDFYTALLRTGFAAISMASEAVYLNEDRAVSLKRHTWLEEARYREAEDLQQRWAGLGLPHSNYEGTGAIELIPVQGGSLATTSGYARERAAQKVPRRRGEKGVRSGVGIMERSSSWLTAFEYLLAVGRLQLKIAAILTLWFLALIRIRIQPPWLLKLARRPKDGEEARRNPKSSRKRRGAALEYKDDGRIPRTDGIDVEAEFRRGSSGKNETDLDDDLYDYWLQGGWWGSADASGDYVPTDSEDDYDTTSIVSMSTAASGLDEDNEWESESEGRRTPVPGTPRASRESTPVVDSPMAMGDLARLLRPKNPEERQAAHTLAAHLQSDEIMTRSRFRRQEQLQRTRVLTSSSVTGFGRQQRLSQEEEENLLEHLLLARRQRALAPGTTAVVTDQRQPNASVATGWDADGPGSGTDGPQCVVCQSSARTVIVWPCRCLSLCDDCRISLAMNNFDKCVCCRREVVSFSRIYVP